MATIHETTITDNGNTSLPRDTAVNDILSDHLRVLDSRTGKIHNIPISDGFVLGSDLGSITAPIAGGNGHQQPLAVLDPGFQHTACKESAITLM